jgi:hypothetical protein
MRVAFPRTRLDTPRRTNSSDSHLGTEMSTSPLPDSDRTATPFIGSSQRTAAVTHLEEVRGDRVAAERQRREATRIRELTSLLRDRPDLDGVLVYADFTLSSLRWCV